jgi:hypothetical protein
VTCAFAANERHLNSEKSISIGRQRSSTVNSGLCLCRPTCSIGASEAVGGSFPSSRWCRGRERGTPGRRQRRCCRVPAAIDKRLAVALRVTASNGNNPESAEPGRRGQGVDGDLAARAAAVSAGSSFAVRQVRQVAAQCGPPQALSGHVGLRSVLDSLSNLCSIVWFGGDLARPGRGPADRGAAGAVRGAARRRPGHRPRAGRHGRAVPPRRRHPDLEPHAA